MADNQTLTIQLQAKDNASKQIQDAGRKISDAVKGIGDAAKKISTYSAAALAGMTAFAVKSVKDMGSLAEEIDNMQKRTGLATASISALRLAADQTSVPIDAMELGMKKLGINILDMQDAGVKAQKSIKDLGLKFKDIQDLPIEKQFFTIGNAIAKLDDPTERVRKSVELFGKAGTDLLPIFGEGSMTLQEWTKKAEEMGVMLDSKTIDSALKADQAFDDFEGTVKGLVNTAAQNFLPVVTEMVEGLTPLIQQVGNWVKQNPELVKQIAEWTVKLLAAGAALGPFVKLMEGLSATMSVAKSIGEVSTALKILTGVGLGGWGLALAAIIASLTWILMNWEEVSTGIESIAKKLGLISETSKEAQLELSRLQQVSVRVGNEIGTKSQIDPKYYGAPKSIMDKNFGSYLGVTAEARGAVGKETISAGTPGFFGGTGFLGMFANGGRPGMGRPSIVGENGPELFVPDQVGTVIPNSRLGGSSVNITITGNTLLDHNAAEKIGDMIFDKLRLQQRIS